MRKRNLFFLLAGLSLPVFAQEACFDFESGDSQGWILREGVLGQLITNQPKEHNSKRAYPKQGKWFLSTLESPGQTPDDSYMGVVESPVVRLKEGRVSLMVGGGSRKNVYFAVCSPDGKELAYARGRDSEKMWPANLTFPLPKDSLVFFRVVDHAQGSWAHLTVDMISFQGAVDRAATADREKFYRRQRLLPKFETAEKAIKELGARNSAYPAQKFLSQLEQLKETINSEEELRPILQEALIRQNPILNQAEVLYVTRKQYRDDHHNTATLFQAGEINEHSYQTQGALKALDVKTGKVRVIVPEEKGRTIRDPEVNYDGKKIVFAMRGGRKGDYKIWTVKPDGSQLTQLTFAKGVTDIDPVFLPEGDVVFGSTREPKYCMCNRHIMCNLYRMTSTGKNICQIGKSTLFEGHPVILKDGRILYDRWEYVDRNFGDAQGLWVCNPDGTGHAIYWGNNTTSPGGVVMARPLNKSSRVISVMGSCHDRPWGALALIDRSKGVDGKEPVLRTWPAEYRDRIRVEGENFDSTKYIRLKYSEPFPLDDSHFIASRMTGNGEEMGLVYLDLWGNEILFHKDAPGCHSPMLLRASAVPHKQPIRRHFSDPKAPGSFYLQNVYIGTHMKGVKPGSVKALRIVESPEKRNWTRPSGWFGHGEEAPAMNWHSFENKRILGTVPVEADGSAHFEVPANTFVFFQALDKDGKMIQSMRSGAYVQPGELYGCVGCHENRVGNIPPTDSNLIAFKRPAGKLNGWYGKPRLFSYQKEIQPIFTKHCMACHDYGKKAAPKLNLAADRDVFFNTSYVDLWARGAIHCVGGGPAEIQQAYSWGSHASKLTKKLYGHGKVALTPEERDKIITWMDINAVYYPCYECAYPNNPGGRSPLTQKELNRLHELTGIKIANAHYPRQRAQISFDRPEMSRILDGLRNDQSKKAAYDEALALIREGQARLQALPRADMEGFIPCRDDLKRENRYYNRLQEERAVYKAIREGKERDDKAERAEPEPTPVTKSRELFNGRGGGTAW